MMSKEVKKRTVNEKLTSVMVNFTKILTVVVVIVALKGDGLFLYVDSWCRHSKATALNEKTKTRFYFILSRCQIHNRAL